MPKTIKQPQILEVYFASILPLFIRKMKWRSHKTSSFCFVQTVLESSQGMKNVFFEINIVNLKCF